MEDKLQQSALDFHEFPNPGKITVTPTKPLITQRDLALAHRVLRLLALKLRLIL